MQSGQREAPTVVGAVHGHPGTRALHAADLAVCNVAFLACLGGPTGRRGSH
jgi:hypothetical protein